jgi:hypothetical protein
LADNLTENADNPREASRLASEAYTRSLSNAMTPYRRTGYPSSLAARKKKYRRLTVKRGESVYLRITGI